ncbi:MAG: hypothetical protein WAW52_13610 [Methanothrix sp.]
MEDFCLPKIQSFNWRLIQPVACRSTVIASHLASIMASSLCRTGLVMKSFITASLLACEFCLWPRNRPFQAFGSPSAPDDIGYHRYDLLVLGLAVICSLLGFSQNFLNLFAVDDVIAHNSKNSPINSNSNSNH